MPSDDVLARELALGAGELLVSLRADYDQEQDRRREGDRRSHQWLMEQLSAQRPKDSVLSEEGRDDASRLRASRVWIVDPLDGTREFGELPRIDWAVHVALWQDGELVAGAVAQPGAGTVFATDQPPARPKGTPKRIRLAVSRTRPPQFVTELAAALDAELVPMGSAGVKATAVLRDEVDAYVHAGGQYEWDSAAPVAVARAAGLHTSRIDGSPLVYNQPDPLLPDLLIARPEICEQLLEFIAHTAQKGGTA